ncbi:MAG: endopeptidase La [Candidatus Makana argininalis]
MNSNLDINNLILIPVLTLRDVVVYPYMIIPLFIGRKKSIKCLEKAIKLNKKVIIVTQKESIQDNPDITDIYNVGTLSFILQIIKLPDGTIKVLIEGLKKVKIKHLCDNGEYFVSEIHDVKIKKLDFKIKEILMRTLLNQFKIYIKLNKKIPKEVIDSLSSINDVSRLVDTIASHIPLKISDKQLILEINNIKEQIEYLMKMLELEIDLLKIEKKIRNRVRNQMEKSQRDYYLNEQIKAIQKEIGDIDEIKNENEILKKKIANTKMSKEAKAKVTSEFNKLKLMSSMSAESTVVRSYIECILSIPWCIKSNIKKDIIKAKNILEKDHYGLDNIKERILEYLSVQSRKNKTKGPIICLVGPPGVGKTSLGKSIAKATGRKYIRISLGGVRDEAEIRGHRRTYIGSMPGKIMQKMSKIGVKNPLFLLDEIDKMSFDTRGDPSSALLEVLDPEQNITFNDNYIEVDYDLSDVMFLATSNSMNISPPLLDRLEIIKISGYTEDEKINIAINYLIPKQKKRNAVKNNELEIKKSAILNIVRYYTRESGVRNLEREISKICRKTVKKLVINKNIKHIYINKNNLKKFLGIKKFNYGYAEKKNIIGQVTGLAWTDTGGELLTIETVSVPGNGKLIYTGSLGNVMKESIQAALTLVKSLTFKIGINNYLYETQDLHIHVPEGAIPKDGPSAGIAICSSIFSCISKNPVKSYIAMTGEITLRGQILPIGGLKEKLLAAHRGGIKKVLIPYANKKDLEDIPINILKILNIKIVNKIEEVLMISLKNNPFKTKNIEDMLI